jgi:hypothetical protein
VGGGLGIGRKERRHLKGRLVRGEARYGLGVVSSSTK